MSVPQITWCLTGYCIAVQCDCYFFFFSDVLPLINKICLLPHPPSSWFLPEMSFINKPQQLCEDVCTPVLDSCIDCCCVFSLFILRCAPQPTHQRRPPTSLTRWLCSPGWRPPRASTAAVAEAPWPPPWPPHRHPTRLAAGGSHQMYLMCRSLHRDSGLRGSPPHSPAQPGRREWTRIRAQSRRLV